MKSILTLPILVCVIVLASGCIFTLFGTVVVRDAYCDLDNNFTFTLENTGGSNRTIAYTWTLNDPMADMPLYRGEGSIVLKPHESRTLTFNPDVPFHRNSLMGCVICITLYTDGKEIYRFKEQKSSLDWDYSVEPPVRYLIKPETMSFLFSTVIERNSDGDYIVTVANSSYAPKRTAPGVPRSTAPGPKISQIYLGIGETGWWTSRIASPLQNGSAPAFVDRDGNSCITQGDYYILPGTFAGETVRFRSASGYILLTHTRYAPESERPIYSVCQLPPDDDQIRRSGE
ncbi:hypothetical protein [Methanoculleus sp.]|uniref:hypothetical protein n=1 Tax=Methanoculleus sp. TaxID=90427 RepID=UPI0025E0D992|nr:hypothetical protein [Methanoculleus sp.]